MDFELFRQKSAENRLIFGTFWHARPGSNRGPRAQEISPAALTTRHDCCSNTSIRSDSQAFMYHENKRFATSNYAFFWPPISKRLARPLKNGQCSKYNSVPGCASYNNAFIQNTVNHRVRSNRLLDKQKQRLFLKNYQRHSNMPRGHCVPYR